MQGSLKVLQPKPHTYLLSMHEAVCLRQACEGVVQAVSHSEAATLDTKAAEQEISSRATPMQNNRQWSRQSGQAQLVKSVLLWELVLHTQIPARFPTHSCAPLHALILTVLPRAARHTHTRPLL
jgi:hypothetical protein